MLNVISAVSRKGMQHYLTIRDSKLAVIGLKLAPLAKSKRTETPQPTKITSDVDDI